MASGAAHGSTPATSSSARTNSTENIALVPHTRIDHESKIEEFYQTGKKLGQGSFGVVRMVTHKETGTIWACKGVSKEKVKYTYYFVLFKWWIHVCESYFLVLRHSYGFYFLDLFTCGIQFVL